MKASKVIVMVSFYLCKKFMEAWHPCFRQKTFNVMELADIPGQVRILRGVSETGILPSGPSLFTGTQKSNLIKDSKAKSTQIGTLLPRGFCYRSKGSQSGNLAMKEGELGHLVLSVFKLQANSKKQGICICHFPGQHDLF